MLLHNHEDDFQSSMSEREMNDVKGALLMSVLHTIWIQKQKKMHGRTE
jgi:hypothetical protein